MVAEGAETTTDLEDLTQLGVDYIQGFLFGTPMSADEVRKLMEKAKKSMPKVSPVVSADLERPVPAAAETATADTAAPAEPG